jgi:hypothetical protein
MIEALEGLAQKSLLKTLQQFLGRFGLMKSLWPCPMMAIAMKL